MKCFHAHTPSHSPTPSHMPIPSVEIFTANANDTHISNLCRLTNTQCNLPMGNQPRVNPDSYNSTLGLCDKHDHVYSFWATELFGLHRGSLTPTQNFPDNTASLLHPYRTFGSRHRSLTPILNFRIFPQVSYT